MIPGLEKKKLEKLYNRTISLSPEKDESLDHINDIYKEYVQIIKKLHAKEPNIFANLHKYGLAELKVHKEDIRKNANQQIFEEFKSAIESAIEDALVYMKDYLHV